MDNNGNSIEGIASSADYERSFLFTPTRGWKKNDYQIIFETRLEDLAGNNLVRLFDRDLTQPLKDFKNETFQKKFSVN